MQSIKALDNDERLRDGSGSGDLLLHF